MVGTDLASRHWCGQNKNFLEIFKMKVPNRIGQFCGDKRSGFDFLNNPIPEAEWVLVHRTEYISQNNCAAWNEFKIQKSKFCYEMEDTPLMFKVLDYALHNGNHSLIGGVIRTFEELRIDLKNHSKLEIMKPGRQNRGFLQLKAIKESNPYLQSIQIRLPRLPQRRSQHRSFHWNRFHSIKRPSRHSKESALCKPE